MRRLHLRTADPPNDAVLRRMFRCFRTSAGRLIRRAKEEASPMTLTMCTIASSAAAPSFLSPLPSNVRRSPFSARSVTTMNTDHDPSEVEALFKQKHSLRTKMRKTLRSMDPVQRSAEDNVIQGFVLEAPWFKASKSICAYISCPALREVDTSRIVSEILSNPTTESNGQIMKNLYVPRVEDRNSNMRMLHISSVDDLVLNSMNILEPDLLDSHGNQREDVMQANEPVDLLLLPGLAFDRSGRRLGRSGGYYDLFVERYRKVAEQKKWQQPLLVALAYSVQIVEEGVIAVTPNDVPVDALVSPAGFIPITPAAFRSCA